MRPLAPRLSVARFTRGAPQARSPQNATTPTGHPTGSAATIPNPGFKTYSKRPVYRCEDALQPRMRKKGSYCQGAELTQVPGGYRTTLPRRRRGTGCEPFPLDRRPRGAHSMAGCSLGGTAAVQDRRLVLNLIGGRHGNDRRRRMSPRPRFTQGRSTSGDPRPRGHSDFSGGSSCARCLTSRTTTDVYGPAIDPFQKGVRTALPKVCANHGTSLDSIQAGIVLHLGALGRRSLAWLRGCVR